MVFAEGRAPTDRPAVGNTSLCWGQLASLYDWQCYAKDIVVRRSTTGGFTCSAVQALAESNASVLYTNPLGLLDVQTQTLWLAYVRCPIPPGAPAPGRSVFQQCTQIVRASGDHGVSWGAEAAIPGSSPQSDGGVSQCRYCRSAAPPSPFSRCSTSAKEGVSPF